MAESLATTQSRYTPIAVRRWRAGHRASGAMQAVVLTVLGSLLLTLSAKVQVPFWPVPMTMQTYVVVLLGVAYGWRLGLATVALYLAEGALGLPVFAGTPERGVGLVYMAGPTGGYLLGFLVAATVCGWLAERGFARTLPLLAFVALAGHAIMLVPGVAWLSTFVGFKEAVALGFAPFWAATLLKSALAVGTIMGFDRRMSV